LPNASAAGARQGQIDRRHDLRLEPLHLRQQDPRREQEDAGVPQVPAARDIGLGRGEIRLLGEPGDLAHRPIDLLAALDVSVTGLRAGRGDAERHDVFARGAERPRDGFAEPGGVGDVVVRRHQDHQGVGVDLLSQARDGDRRRRAVAAHRLQHDRRRVHGDLEHLFGHDVEVAFAADQDRGQHLDRARRRDEPSQGVLQQGPSRRQGVKLLGRGVRGQGPEPGARPTGQHRWKQTDGHQDSCRLARPYFDLKSDGVNGGGGSSGGCGEVGRRLDGAQ
jgi:hypothetical protein